MLFLHQSYATEAVEGFHVQQFIERELQPSREHDASTHAR